MRSIHAHHPSQTSHPTPAKRHTPSQPNFTSHPSQTSHPTPAKLHIPPQPNPIPPEPQIEDAELREMIAEADHSGTGDVGQEDFIKIVTSYAQHYDGEK